MCLHASVLVFFNDTATTEIYTLSLHDALPISLGHRRRRLRFPKSALAPRTEGGAARCDDGEEESRPKADRKSTRLNSSHANISYAVFCLKKKKYPLSRYLMTTCIH